MENNHRTIRRFLCTAGAVFFLMAGCAPQKTGRLIRFDAVSGETSDTGNMFWWACRFKIHWPDEKHRFDSAVDLLLADGVIEPVLNANARELYFWRFHRRAIRDATGHQFSFLFYTDPDTARKVFGHIREKPLLADLITENIVEKTIVDDPDAPHRSQIQDTSDPQWSASLRRHWPSFIMGVSAVWLGLINDAMAGASSDKPDVDVHHLLAQYREAEAQITTIWWNEGQHAFLHHLNALFGYQPLLIQKELRF